MHLSDIQGKLKEIGKMSDGEMPLSETLLLLGAVEQEGADLTPYRAHLENLRGALERYLEENPKNPETDVLEYRLGAMNAVVCVRFGYEGDKTEDADPTTMNMLSTIDRKRGIPVALGLLYMILAEDRGWKVSGLNFPGRFLLRLEDGAHRLIFDPFESGKIMQASDMRRLAKLALGEKAELNHNYYDAISRREAILRLGNNRRICLIALGDYTRACQIVTHQLWIAPDEPRLYYDAGVICAKIGQLQDARDYLQEFIDRSDDVQSIAEAQNILASLRRILQ